MNKSIFTALWFYACCMMSLTASAQTDYIRFVDPFIGSGGHGHVFVGASVPFGAVQPGPTNIYKGWDWCSGYHYSDSIVIGFSHNHLSGTGCADLGDVSLMPYSGRLRTARGEQNDITDAASSYYKHTNEQAEPGYYAVKLDNGVRVELTATQRAAMHHYEFTGSGESHVLIDLVNGIGNRTYESYICQKNDHEIEGYRFSNGWAPRHKVFFHIEFSEPIKRLATFNNDDPAGLRELQANNVKAVASLGDVRDVLVKVGISSVSCNNAKMNIEAEMPMWSFDVIKDLAQSQWNDMLSLIDIDGTQQQKRIFYTAMYHAFLAPNIYCDINGEYRGIDDKIYPDQGFTNYTTFSTWDTYRTLHPLYTIIATQAVSHMVNSMLSIANQNRKLPIWPLYMGETNCMPGYSSVPIIADAYLKGISGFDPKDAFAKCIATATNPEQNGIPEFMHYGYIPADKKPEATSINLEYAVDDCAIALMAKKMGLSNEYQTFMKRGKSYALLFDTKINKIHPKMADGTWYEPYNPFLANHRNGIGDFTEGNGWQYTFMVPQDPEGLITLHGGDQKFITNLDSLFIAEGDLGEGAPPDVSGMIGQYAQGNEPNHHIPYLYTYAGAQYKTAERVRMLQQRFYKDEPDGYAGNEDCGQMSAWHIMSALGFYQVNPSNGVYVFGSPLFKRASIRLPHGKKFVITAPNNSNRNIYIQSAKLNGRPYQKAFITYSDIMQGGTLEFRMGSKPNKRFGQAQADRPVSAH